MDAVGLGAGAGGGAASRQQMQHYAKRMLEMMEQQLRPLTGAYVERQQQQRWLRQRWRQLSKDPAGGASAASILWRTSLQPLPTLPELTLPTAHYCLTAFRATREAERSAASRLWLPAGEWHTWLLCRALLWGSELQVPGAANLSQLARRRHAGACFALALSMPAASSCLIACPVVPRRTGTSGSTTCSGGGRSRRRRRGPRWRGGGWIRYARLPCLTWPVCFGAWAVASCSVRAVELNLKWQHFLFIHKQYPL